MKQIKKIIIFGGGTSGWLAAAHLSNTLQNPVEIMLIEDASAGPIGVGEGTQPLTAKFLHECGLMPKDWMKPSKAALKLGVELSGWNDDPYFVDNDDANNYVPAQDKLINNYFITKPYKEYADWHPAYRIAKNNTSPKLTEFTDVNFGNGLDSFGAVHFSAYDIIDTIKRIISNRITYVDTKIVNAETDSTGITKLIDEEGRFYTADLYLDCSGFNSVLLEKTLKSEWISYTDNGWLLNDSAVAMPTQYNNPKEECHPYTKATTMNAGWRWTIPTYNRIGNGYVYSSKFISKEAAEQELREALNDFETPVKHLKMKCGTHKAIALKNVCGVGLAGGFVEPLEATGITFTTAVIKSVSDLLNMYQNNWNDEVLDHLNQGWYEMSIEILTFIWAHYYFSSRNDTPYWQEIRKQKIEDLPTNAQYMLSNYYPDLKNFLYFSPQSMFTSQQWFSMLHAGGAYKNIIKQLDPKEKQYYEYFIQVQNKRVELALETFPNHYEFLKEWYDGWTTN